MKSLLLNARVNVSRDGRGWPVVKAERRYWMLHKRRVWPVDDWEMRVLTLAILAGRDAGNHHPPTAAAAVGSGKA